MSRTVITGNSRPQGTPVAGLVDAGPELPIDEGIEPCSFYKHNGLYIVNAQFAPRGISEGGAKAGRQGWAWISTDFDRWLQAGAESFTLPEAVDPAGRGLGKP